ncbi:E1 [Apodemus sylvaticus papillomavirus 1]|uniref:Replication protein E1 n=1 Tax=Apodemus sylvaticus papillomavirus 1 TaxID=1036963 RepID=F8SIM5_9PAPI|nr:E1 [Apodemus sylvaticus papillomavirus 1]AEI00706.1 E1 [Apodemus sylvaticus papillomavirus 1]
MDDGKPGTGQYSGWFYIDREAECNDNDVEGPLDNFEALFEQSTQGSLIDNDEVDQGNSLALFTNQIFEEDEQRIATLKRKYAQTPRKENSLEIESLSPRLESVRISPRGKTSRRKLFEDSGIGHETQNTPPGTGNEVASLSISASGSSSSSNVSTGSSSCEDLLRANNRLAACLGKFKNAFGVSFTELTRSFKSNKTCSHHWTVCVFGAAEVLIEAAKQILQPQCAFLQELTSFVEERRVTLMLLESKAGKCRDTLIKPLAQVLGVDEKLILSDPPNIRSSLAAFFYYKKILFKGNACYFYGQTPDWIAKHTLLEHQAANAESFDFSRMVQWAYDNNLNEESEIAYKYALEAETDTNTEAWLKTTNQVKHVRDCCQMVRLYRRQEMREMTMSQWIRKCCKEHTEDGDWKVIAGFIRYQEVNFVMLLTALRHMFNGTPKKHCLVITGPPDTGKSYFCTSLTNFLHGRVIFFMNSKSQFWLQPLADAKLGFLDDATHACWSFMDIYMRNGLDGNAAQVDMKHKAPIQIKLPPLLVTTNVDVMNNDNYKYLHSRLQCFAFLKPMPLDANGHPQFPLTAANWKSFFVRLGKQLGLEEEEVQDDDESAGNTFRCSARTNSQSL